MTNPITAGDALTKEIDKLLKEHEEQTEKAKKAKVAYVRAHAQNYLDPDEGTQEMRKKRADLKSMQEYEDRIYAELQLKHIEIALEEMQARRMWEQSVLKTEWQQVRHTEG